jgi:hypothetical protein
MVPTKRRESAAIQPATAVREFIKSDQFDVVYVVAFSVHLAMTAYGAKPPVGGNFVPLLGAKADIQTTRAASGRTNHPFPTRS